MAAAVRMSEKPPLIGRPDPRRREPLWDRVDRNRLRLFGYVTAFSVVSTFWVALVIWVALGTLVAFGLELAPPLAEFSTSLLFGAAISLSHVWVTLARSERWLVARLQAAFVPKGELLESKMALKDMAIAGGLPVAPALYLMDSTNTNAFVFHALGRRPIAGVTKGFVEKLSIDQQRAVFANLVARLIRGDIMVASATTALVAPLQAWREYRIGRSDEEYEFLAAASERAKYAYDDRLVRTSGAVGPDILLATYPLLPFGLAIILLAEIVAMLHRRSQLTAAEKADAEGMLLLKEPSAMLSALERCVRLDNVVPAAGETFGELFYCWTGDSTNDEEDPEWRRVARLREVLGVEGFVPDDEALQTTAVAPAAPRIG